MNICIYILFLRKSNYKRIINEKGSYYEFLINKLKNCKECLLYGFYI